jgi:hypothetical protein
MIRSRLMSAHHKPEFERVADSARELDEHARVCLKELEDSGEVININRSYDGPLPVIRLAKSVRLDRIIRVSKR